MCVLNVRFIFYRFNLFVLIDFIQFKNAVTSRKNHATWVFQPVPITFYISLYVSVMKNSIAKVRLAIFKWRKRVSYTRHDKYWDVRALHTVLIVGVLLNYWRNASEVRALILSPSTTKGLVNLSNVSRNQFD